MGSPHGRLRLLVPPGALGCEVRTGDLLAIYWDGEGEPHLTGRVSAVGPAAGCRARRGRIPASDPRLAVTLALRDLLPGERPTLVMTTRGGVETWDVRRRKTRS